MAVLAHVAVVGSLVLACLASPPSPSPDGTWSFQRIPEQPELGCAAVLDGASDGLQLRVGIPASDTGGLTTQVAGRGRGVFAPAGVIGTIALPGGPIYRVQAGPGVDTNAGLVLMALDAPASLSGMVAAGAADGTMWLDLPGFPPLALPADGWRDAMRQVAACAS